MKIGGVLAAVLFAGLALAASGSNVAVDGPGNIWRTGRNLPVALTANAFQKTAAQTNCATEQLSPFEPIISIPCDHAYVTKEDPSGNILYATYLGGSGEDGGVAIVTDAQGNAYVTGFTYSADFPVTAGVVQQKNAGPLMPSVVFEGLGPYGPVALYAGGDAFVAKFSPDGALLYSTLLGGTGSEIPALIGVDSLGSVYLAGTTSSADFPVTPDALTHQLDSALANFFVRLDAQAASLVYATYSDATIQSFDTDDVGNAFLTGSMQPASGDAGPYVTEVDTSDGQVRYNTFLPDLDAKFVGAGAAIGVNAAGEAWVGVSPAPRLSGLLVPAPLLLPLGPSFLLMLAAFGGGVAAETDIDNTQFDHVLVEGDGSAYAFGHGTGTLPKAPVAALLTMPCSSAGGEFVIETNAGGVEAATYLRQGTGEVVAIDAPGQVLVYRAASQNMVAVDLLAAPAMNFGCLQNLASGQIGQGVAPGEIFVLYGSGLGPAQAAVGTLDESGRFPTSLAGTQVLVNGTAAPLLLVEAGEIQGVVPFGLTTQVATVEVQVAQDASQSAQPLDAPNQYNPGIFTINGQAAVLNQDGTVNTPANPAKLGTIVAIFATGTGALETATPDGELTPLPPPYFALATPPQVTFAGMTANVVWAGAAPGLIAGAAQINAQLPPSFPDGTNLAAIPVMLIPPGAFSPTAPISVE